MARSEDRLNCHLCEQRPPRRHCPALLSEICAPCCGESREETVDCPLDCEFLREARRHEKPIEVDAKSLPHPEIEVSDRFMEQNQPLAIVAGRLLLVASIQTPGTVDFDLRDALAALTQTYKTATSGLIYDSRPANAIAAQVVDLFQQEMTRFRERVAEQAGSHSFTDKDLLGVLIFWQRMQWQSHNGRRKGRAFLESLYSLLPPPADSVPNE